MPARVSGGRRLPCLPSTHGLSVAAGMVLWHGSSTKTSDLGRACCSHGQTGESLASPMVVVAVVVAVVAAVAAVVVLKLSIRAEEDLIFHCQRKMGVASGFKYKVLKSS